MNEPDDSSDHHALNDSKHSNVPSRVLKFGELAKGKNELLIEHQGQTYSLRSTKNGKLLLNK